MPTAASTKQDAQEYGNHVRHGGFQLGKLVARNVAKGKGNGERGPSNGKREACAIAQASDKVSAAEFGRLSRTSHKRVLLHLEAWERAAAAGLVPHAAELVPGQDIDLPEDEDGKRWAEFYRSTPEPKPEPKPKAKVSEERAASLEKAAEEQGVAAEEVKDLAGKPEVVVAAIKGDPQTAAVAEGALAEAKEADEKAREAGQPQRPDFFAPLRSIDRLHAQLVEIEHSAHTEWSEEQRRFAAERLEPHRHTIGMIIDEMQGPSDAALAALLEQQREAD